MSDDMRIKVTKNGPYMVFGGVPLKEEVIKKDAMGKPVEWVEVKKFYVNDPTYKLCRCGKSNDRPFCTGDHVGFDGTETAKRSTFDENAKSYPGIEGVEVLQDPAFCIGAGFCHARQSVDKAIKNKDTLDNALQQTYDCLSGSLLIKIDGEAQEPKLEKGISVTAAKGTFLVKGGIPVESADGYTYEVRNRVALCGCGKSKNKPFCDASHLR